MLNIEKGVVGTWFQVFAKPSVRVIPENSKEAPVRNEAARLLLEESPGTVRTDALGNFRQETCFFYFMGNVYCEIKSRNPVYQTTQKKKRRK